MASDGDRRGSAQAGGKRLRGLLRLLREHRGSAIIEFAFVAAPLIALLMAILETSIVFFAQEGLETTAEVAARQLMTGQAQTANMNAASFKAYACTALPPYLSCSNLMVDVTTSADFTTAYTGTPTFTYNSKGNISNTWSYSPGAAGSIVVMRLMYIWPLPTAPLGFSLNNINASQRLMMATSVARTEPYTS